MAKSKNSKLQALTKRLKSIKAKDIMAKDVVTTKEGTSLSKIAEIMVKDRISGLPVVGKKGKVVGVITATDLFIVMDMIKFGDVVEENAKSVSDPTAKLAMSTELIKINKNTTLEEIITLMKYKNAQTLPVFAGSKLVGVIGRHDVFKNFYTALKALYL